MFFTVLGAPGSNSKLPQLQHFWDVDGRTSKPLDLLFWRGAYFGVLSLGGESGVKFFWSLSAFCFSLLRFASLLV